MTLTKDKIIEEAKDKYNVSLNPKNKLVDLEAQLNNLKEKNKPSKKEKKDKKVSKTPLFSRGSFGKVILYNPIHRDEYWTFLYSEDALTDEEKKSLGL
nr:hypothetical protein [uncultured Mediterranean phage uvMED]BAR25763.1 hypothetical protein [uncultured Mediterranean phage uvMED]